MVSSDSSSNSTLVVTAKLCTRGSAGMAAVRCGVGMLGWGPPGRDTALDPVPQPCRTAGARQASWLELQGRGEPERADAGPKGACPRLRH